MTDNITISGLEQSNKDRLEAIEERLQKLSGLNGRNDELLSLIARYLGRVKWMENRHQQRDELERIERFTEEQKQLIEQSNKLSDQVFEVCVSIRITPL